MNPKGKNTETAKCAHQPINNLKRDMITSLVHSFGHPFRMFRHFITITLHGILFYWLRVLRSVGMINPPRNKNLVVIWSFLKYPPETVYIRHGPVFCIVSSAIKPFSLMRLLDIGIGCSQAHPPATSTNPAEPIPMNLNTLLHIVSLGKYDFLWTTTTGLGRRKRSKDWFPVLQGWFYSTASRIIVPFLVLLPWCGSFNLYCLYRIY